MNFKHINYQLVKTLIIGVIELVKTEEEFRSSSNGRTEDPKFLCPFKPSVSCCYVHAWKIYFTKEEDLKCNVQASQYDKD